MTRGKRRGRVEDPENQRALAASLPRQLRLAAGLTGWELAQRLGCTPTTVYQTERRGKHVEIATVERWATECGLRVSWLILAAELSTRPDGSAQV